MPHSFPLPTARSSDLCSGTSLPLSPPLWRHHAMTRGWPHPFYPSHPPCHRRDGLCETHWLPEQPFLLAFCCHSAAFQVPRCSARPCPGPTCSLQHPQQACPACGPWPVSIPELPDLSLWARLRDPDTKLQLPLPHSDGPGPISAGLGTGLLKRPTRNPHLLSFLTGAQTSAQPPYPDPGQARGALSLPIKHLCPRLSKHRKSPVPPLAA